MTTTRQILEYLDGLVGSLSGVQWVTIGVPKSVPAQVGAFVTAGGQRTPPKTISTVMKERRYRVTFAYALDSAAEAAELTICDLVDALTETLLADPTLGGLVGTTEIDASIADDPRYADRPEEVREYPVALMTRNQEPGRTAV